MLARYQNKDKERLKREGIVEYSDDYGEGCIMNNFDSEIPKHKKKKESSISKSKEKSKHKHEYVDCLLIEDGIKPYKAEYCKICGKVGDVKFFEPEKAGHGTYRRLNEKAVFEKYKNLPVIQVKDIFQKYIVMQEKI